MAYYCSDCVTWINSRDANRYGEKWCDHDNKYRAADQNILGCPGFVWARRSIITKVCEILGINNSELFDCFDEVKENYLVPNHIEELCDYNLVGPMICERISNDPNKKAITKNILDCYIIPAAAYTKVGDYEKATSIYHTMVLTLAILYQVTKDDISDAERCNNLVKVRI